jgi:hypothetical protein
MGPVDSAQGGEQDEELLADPVWREDPHDSPYWEGLFRRAFRRGGRESELLHALRWARAAGARIEWSRTGARITQGELAADEYAEICDEYFAPRSELLASLLREIRPLRGSGIMSDEPNGADDLRTTADDLSKETLAGDGATERVAGQEEGQEPSAAGRPPGQEDAAARAREGPKMAAGAALNGAEGRPGKREILAAFSEDHVIDTPGVRTSHAEVCEGAATYCKWNGYEPLDPDELAGWLADVRGVAWAEGPDGVRHWQDIELEGLGL